MKKIKQGKGGKRKIGRNKRAVDSNMSAYVRGKITFDQYYKNRQGK
jgi:hypothetical protein